MANRDNVNSTTPVSASVAASVSKAAEARRLFLEHLKAIQGDTAESRKRTRVLIEQQRSRKIRVTV